MHASSHLYEGGSNTCGVHSHVSVRMHAFETPNTIPKYRANVVNALYDSLKLVQLNLYSRSIENSIRSNSCKKNHDLYES